MTIKSTLLALILALLSVLVLPASDTYAQLDRVCDVEPSSTLCQDSQESTGDGSGRLYGPNGLLTNIAELLAVIAGALGVLFIALAGFKLITASGDSGNIAAARTMILYAVLGLVVAATAQSIALFVLDRLPG